MTDGITGVLVGLLLGAGVVYAAFSRDWRVSGPPPKVPLKHRPGWGVPPSRP